VTSPYRKITGRAIDTDGLSPRQKDLLSTIFEEYRKRPDWGRFSSFWINLIREELDALKPDDGTNHPLYLIAQDLEMRLGISQGAVAEPDYRDYLYDRIKEKFGSRYRFSKETGIPESFLSQVFSGKKDFSIETLCRAADALDLKLALIPKGDFAEIR
jgi:hypothetical protein